MQLAAEQEKDQAQLDLTEDLVEVLENHLILEVQETHLLKLLLPQEQGKVILEDQEENHHLEIQELVAAEAAVSAALELHHLIFHQCHQWRNHHHQPISDQGRKLKAKRLPTSRGQHRQGITTGQNSFHHRTLASPEGRPAEMVVE